jgi:GAF domain-containing protein
VPGRPAIAKVANVAFLVFFALYTAGSIIWLLAGVPPILASRVPAVHETLHRWGAGDHGYIVASRRGLEQRASAASRRVPAQELAVRAGTQVVIWFENDEPGVPHNLAIYQDTVSGRVVVFRGPTTIGRARSELRFLAPAPGDYSFSDELHRSTPVEFVVVEPDRQIPAWVQWVPGLRTAAAGAAIDSHLVKPAGEVLLQYLFSALSLGLGILLIRVRPHDLAARLLALGMIGTAAVFNFQAHSGLEEMPGLALKLHDNYHLFAGLAYVYALLVFPDGKLAGPWSGPRWFKWPLRAVYLVAITVVVFLNRSRLHGDPTGFVLFFGVLIPIAGITSQAFRLRQASSAAQREQSRVLVWALTLALGAALVLLGLRLVITGAGLDAETVKELDDLAFLVFPVLFAVIPVTLTVVLVRYRLWEIDRVINQTLVYGTLTGVLGLAYVASVVVLQDLLEPITRHSDVVLVASTLAVAALFRPARDRIQAFIDRSFYRSKYDATRTLEAFSARIRDEIDLSTVAGELLVAAEETMRPARMALWLRSQDGVVEDDDLVPAAAAWPPGPTEVPPNRARRAEIMRVEVDRGDPIVAHLEAAGSPVRLDELELISPARDALRAAGMTLVVPLVSQTKLVGLLALGPRRSERDYSGDDRKLLEDLAERAAPALRVAELVRQLVRQQAAELRARERIEQELQVAQLIQRQFLPRELPELPGWQVAAYYQPAKESAGTSTTSSSSPTA